MTHALYKQSQKYTQVNLNLEINYRCHKGTQRWLSTKTAPYSGLLVTAVGDGDTSNSTTEHLLPCNSITISHCASNLKLHSEKEIDFVLPDN